MTLRTLFSFKDTKEIQVYKYLTLWNKRNLLLLFFNFNLKKLVDSSKRAKILADNRNSHHPIETLTHGLWNVLLFLHLSLWVIWNN